MACSLVAGFSHSALFGGSASSCGGRAVLCRVFLLSSLDGPPSGWTQLVYVFSPWVFGLFPLWLF